MGRAKVLLIPMLAMLLALCAGCCRSTCDVWDDTKTAGRYFGKGFGLLTGQQPRCSRQVGSREDFCCVYDRDEDPYGEFIPLQDDEEEPMLGMQSVDFSQPEYFPGEQGSRVPGIDQFKDPASDPQLAQHFQNVEFAFDSSVVKGESNEARLRKVVAFMKKNPQISLFVEGHCDQRGPEAYNLALGTRRANAVRKRLIQEGISKDRIYTISFGKEHPLTRETTEAAHQTNRRAEFRVYRP